MVPYARPTAAILRPAEPLLSADEERELATRALAGDEGAAHRLVRSHVGFVVRIAKRYRNFGVPLSDLVQEGTIGLIHAIKKFDPARNNRLSTYAAWWIRAHIQAHVVRSWSIVRLGTSTAHRALFFRLRRTMAELKDGAGQINEDVLRPLALRFKVPLKEVAGIARRVAGLDRSLAEPVRGGEGSSAQPMTLLDRIADPAPGPEEAASAKSEQRYRESLVKRAMKALSQRERAIIAGRYLAELAKTRDALGRELGISAERVRQLEQAALEKLRRIIAPLQAAI
jgi:RNA polymerase sigma-32 factor